jgi:hypothetical protein
VTVVHSGGGCFANISYTFIDFNFEAKPGYIQWRAGLTSV